jgi:hypothetical protein
MGDDALTEHITAGLIKPDNQTLSLVEIGAALEVDDGIRRDSRPVAPYDEIL